MEINKSGRGFSTRRVTICEKFFARATSEGITVPELRLTGKWLGETVFGVGMRVEVNYVDEKLVISLAKEQPEWVGRKAGKVNNSG